jgi:hypothetical protein
MTTLLHSHRLAALEAAVRRLIEPNVFIVHGGLADSVGPYAHADGIEYEQAPNETFEAFKSRVIAEAVNVHALTANDDKELNIVFGGFAYSRGY